MPLSIHTLQDRAARGEYFEKGREIALWLRRAVLSYAPGDTIPGYTHARAGATATYMDSSRVLQTAPANTLRDNAWFDSNGVLVRHTLAEAATTNLCLGSEDFATGWSVIGTPTRSAAAHTASGVTLDLIGDDDAVGAAEGYQQTLTFTGDAVKAVSAFVKQGSSTSSAFRILDTTASTSRLLGILTWAAGLPVVTMSVGTYLGYVTYADSVYRLLFATTTVTAANGHQIRVHAATDAALSAAGTGTLNVGGVMVEDRPVPSSYVKTTGATATRSADSTPIWAITQIRTPAICTLYVDHTQIGNEYLTGNPSLARVGTTLAPYLAIIAGSGADGRSTAQYADGVTGTQSAGAPAGGIAAFNDRAEAAARILASGKVRLSYAKNLAAEASVDSASANTIPATPWGSLTVRLGSNTGTVPGTIALRRLVFARDLPTFDDLRAMTQAIA